jgi:serine/threonine protein kinase/tetratricopeptide (TPR) repeat protein
MSEHTPDHRRGQGTSGSEGDDRVAELWRLFAEAEGLAGAERRVLLDRVRAERPGLASELEDMLEASGDEAALAIESKLVTSGTAGDASDTMAGPYRLRRRIGGGGMGDVYLAERADDVFEQRVAVKLMRPGIGSAEMLERFRLERDVLARLTHPAIVPLLDGGLTSDGRPYLALQYVEGLPITEYCERAGMSRRERLRLFVDLCRAVQYAHSNLIVHRDLKPSNVLVTAEGEIRLLDFGVAKLLGAGRPGREITGSARAPMTHVRAAPEQHSGGDATTATDVWSLGVLLHELLTGKIPLAATDSGARTDRSGMATGLPRDLASIISMSLAPEPAKRYPSAGHLADDVERCLANQPVQARPDSWLYRTGRTARRHPTLTALGVATVLFLMILSTVSSLQTIRITQQRNRAEVEEQRANAVVDLLVDLFGATDPLQGAEMDMILVADLMDRGEAHANRMADQPDIQARLRAVLGKILLERGDRQRGRALLESALDSQIRFAGPDDPRTVEITLDYVRALHLDGELDAARALVRQTIERLERRNDSDPGQLARALQILGSMMPNEHGEQLIERAISIRRGLPSFDPVEQGGALVVLATHHQIRGERDEARALFQEAVDLLRPALGSDHPQVLGIRSNLAFYLPDPSDQAREHREILRLRSAQLGPDHLLVGNSWIGLAEAQLAEGREAAAEEGFREGWRIWYGASPTASQTQRAARGLMRVLEGQARRTDALEIRDAMGEAFRTAGKEVPEAFLPPSANQPGQS